ncbi:MAG TPA: efflux RND transporter permease subunit [Methylovorus sp.]|nr:efflux RND transporter permease subunit [Methylovorus sp.]
MNISAYSIRNPIPAILLFGLLSIVGLFAFKTSKVQDFPDIELPAVSVTATLEGASPSQLENDVARKIEDSIASVDMVKHITTKILDGQVTISVQFQLEKSVSDAENDVRSAVSRVRSELPADTKDPIVSRITTSGSAIVNYSVTANDLDERDLSWLIDNEIAKKMLSVTGVGKFERVGGVDREVRISLDPEKMVALGVSAATVSSELRRMQLESSGGRTDLGGIRQQVRTLGTVKVASQLRDLQLPTLTGTYVTLGQVADVEDTIAERSHIAMMDGKPVVGFEITRSKGESETGLKARLDQAVAEFNAGHPGVKIATAWENVTPVQDNFDGSMHLLYEGAVLAVLVVMLFLRDFRATIIAAVALPLSVLPTFIGMSVFGYTINTVTLLSLALVVGILVDDAIVEIENIARHLNMGKSPREAAMEAADEIGMAVIATTFALIAVFLPTAFMSGIAGKFFKQFGWTAVFAIFASLAVARLITPMMAAYFLKPKPEKAETDGWITRRYLALVAWSVRHRLVTVSLALLFFVGSLMLIPLLPKGFVPPADRSMTLVNIELAPGAHLQDTARAADQVRELISKNPNVRHVYSSIGNGTSGQGFSAGSTAENRKAVLTVVMVHRTERSITQQKIEGQLREALGALPGMRIKVGSLDTGVKMVLNLQSDDPLALSEATTEVMRGLRTLRNIGNVYSNASLVQPEVIIRPDTARAAALGVTTRDIADVVRIATAGDYDINLPKLNLADRQVPIRIQFPESFRTDLDAISRLTVSGTNGPVRIGNIADIHMGSGPAQIDRFKRVRNVSIEVELGQRELGAVYAEAMQLPAIKNLPPSVHIVPSSDAENMNDLFQSFGLAMAIGVLCIYAVLVLLFRDFMQPLTILMALPLSIGGAFVLLLLTGKSFSMPSLIGLLMLMGIVSKNSILLVEYAIMARSGGHGSGQPQLSRMEALIDACRKRARPIIMTTLAMGAGMVPIALGLGADPSFRSPMAIAVIGGLITSTILSLIVIPAVYTFVDDGEQWLRTRWQRRSGHAH